MGRWAGRLLDNRSRVSAGKTESVPEMDGRDGRTTMGMYLTHT